MRLGSTMNKSTNNLSQPKHNLKKTNTGFLQYKKAKVVSKKNKVITSRIDTGINDLNKTTVLNNRYSYANLKENKEDKVEAVFKKMPFHEMLKEFNSKQDYIMSCMKSYMKEASRNKFQLKNTLKKLEEGRVLREKYHNTLIVQHNSETADIRNTIVEKKMQIQEIRQKTRNLINKKREIENLNHEKVKDVIKVQEKIKEAK